MYRVTACLRIIEEPRTIEVWERLFDTTCEPTYGMTVRLWQDGPVWPIHRSPPVTIEHDGALSARVELVRMDVQPPGSPERRSEGGTMDSPAAFRTFNDDGMLLGEAGWARIDDARRR